MKHSGKRGCMRTPCGSLKKYLAAVERSFAETGKLWEKYDAVTGHKATQNEYTETEMLGWTAGVYSVLYDELGDSI